MELMDQEERETKNRAAWSRWAGVGLEDLANDSTWDEAELNKRYYINAVNGVLDEMRAAVEGLRNDTLNICAFKIGQLSTGLGFPTEPAAILLGKIAMAKGLGKGEVMATLKSGLAGGMKQPRGRQS